MTFLLYDVHKITIKIGQLYNVRKLYEIPSLAH